MYLPKGPSERENTHASEEQGTNEYDQEHHSGSSSRHGIMLHPFRMSFGADFGCG